MSDDADMFGGQPLGVEELRRIAFGGQVNEPRAQGGGARAARSEKLPGQDRQTSSACSPTTRKRRACAPPRPSSWAASGRTRRSNPRPPLGREARPRGPRGLERAAAHQQPARSGSRRAALGGSGVVGAALGPGPFGDVDGGAARVPRGRPRVRAQPPEAAPFLQVDPERAQEIRVAPAAPETIIKSLQELSANPFGIEPSRERAVEMRCGDRELVFLFNRDFVEQAFCELFERKAVAGIVAVRYTVEGDAYSPKYGVLVQPSKSDELKILVTTTKGSSSFRGRAG